jgi:hypothetical protein
MGSSNLAGTKGLLLLATLPLPDGGGAFPPDVCMPDVCMPAGVLVEELIDKCAAGGIEDQI